ncbi:hypothetical protein [Streptococcus infantis]|uniref:hypothetical protein n=1 Tax=Streptococcus infantis TaxID=68892 RepID=UPI001BDB6421|nr:hypothetical protein [Streptococcus infantis]MBT0951449.1 hypothetical protein [Streptococcus infantis]
MEVNNYSLATKPYTRGSGNQITTVVEIRLQDGNRYSTNQRELVGDRTQDKEETLIQAVLDILKSELDPGAAIVQAQSKIEQAEQKLTQTETKQNQLLEITERINKVVRVMAQDSIMGEKIAYGTTYKELVELFPLVKTGESYAPGSMFAIEDPEHVELNGEGKRILVQTNQQFIYQGESLKQLEGSPSQNGILAIWKWDAPKPEKQSSELDTQPVQ